MTYIVFTQLVNEAEHYLESDNKELEVMVALHADQRLGGDEDGETKSYYIADPDVLNRLADQYDMAVDIFEP